MEEFRLDFLFERLMAPLEFGEMALQGHSTFPFLDADDTEECGTENDDDKTKKCEGWVADLYDLSICGELPRLRFQERTMRLKPILTSEDVMKMVAAAKREAGRHGLVATIAVVDQGGDLLYLERPDTHSPNAVEMAAGKARTAAFRERPSSALEERVKERPGFLMTPNQIGVRGGVPLFCHGECVGGIGVSGIGNHDEPTAQAGADALEA